MSERKRMYIASLIMWKNKPALWCLVYVLIYIRSYDRLVRLAKTESRTRDLAIRLGLV